MRKSRPQQGRHAEPAKDPAWSGYQEGQQFSRCAQDPFDFAQGRLFGTEVPHDDASFLEMLEARSQKLEAILLPTSDPESAALPALPTKDDALRP
jgi:hypothetical protein